MRLYKLLLISTTFLFLVANTAYFWEAWVDVWGILIYIFGFLVFLTLLICLIGQLAIILDERFKNKKRIYLAIIMAIVLGLTGIKPHGIIDYEKFEGKDVFVARSEGAANCTNTLKLKENHQFYITDICFGVYKNQGIYDIKDDTIKFKFSIANNIKTYEFGIYKWFNNPNNKTIGKLLLYKCKKDTLPYPMTVYKNELIK
jgi:hypothetical protein